MIKVKLNELLEKEERSMRWVASKTNISVSTLQNLKQGKTTSVSFNVLDSICKLFKCNIEDIIQYIED